MVDNQEKDIMYLSLTKRLDLERKHVGGSLTIIDSSLQLLQSVNNLPVFLGHRCENEHLLHQTQHDYKVIGALSPLELGLKARPTVQQRHRYY